MKRIFTLLFCVALVASLAFSVHTMPAAATVIEATDEDTILIAFSDFQDKGGVSAGKQTLQKMANLLESVGLKKADGLFVAGDYNASGSYTSESTISTNKQSMQAIRDVFSPYVGDNILFAQGNHDLAATPGLAPNGNNDPASGDYGVYLIPEDQYGEWGNTPNETKQAAAELKAYLDAKIAANWKKPIFVINHIPLHWGNRTLKDGSGTQGYQLFNVLNEAGGKGLNIIYLFGHNHSSGYDDFLGSSAIYLKKGDTMEVAQGSKYDYKTETLKFTYMNAGYVGYNSSNNPAADTALTLSVFLIRNNEVIITRYDVSGVHNLKSAGTWHDSFKEAGYHATPNPTVYESSRKVSATDDVEVDPPYYSQRPAPTTTTTTTTQKPTTTTTSAKPIATTSKAPEVTATDTTVASSTTTTVVVVDPIGTGTPSTEAPTSATVTDPTQVVTEPTASATETLSTTTASQSSGEEADAHPGEEPSFPVGLVIGGSVLAVAAVVILLLIKRKK